MRLWVIALCLTVSVSILGAQTSSNTASSNHAEKAQLDPPQAPQAGEPILIVATAPASAPTESASATLPKTASNVPLIGLLGALFCALSLIAMAIRTIVSRSIISQ